MPLTDQQLEHFKQRLLDEKQKVQAILKSNEESSQPVELDQTSVGRLSRQDALQQQQMALAGRRQHEMRLQAIESALKRIETGDYGYCVQTDEEISLKRLELDPTAATALRGTK